MTQAFEPSAGDPKEEIAARVADVRSEIPEYRWSQVIEASLREAASRVALSLSTKQYDDVVDLLDHGEPGIALDLLCSHLYEGDIVVDDAVRWQIANAGNLMGMNPLLWERLTPAPWPEVDAGTWWTLTTGEPDDVEHLSVLRDELKQEIGVGHVLYGEPFDVLARFAGSDEVLLRLTGGRFATILRRGVGDRSRRSGPSWSCVRTLTRRRSRLIASGGDQPGMANQPTPVVVALGSCYELGNG